MFSGKAAYLFSGTLQCFDFNDYFSCYMQWILIFASFTIFIYTWLSVGWCDLMIFFNSIVLVLEIFFFFKHTRLDFIVVI